MKKTILLIISLIAVTFIIMGCGNKTNENPGSTGIGNESTGSGSVENGSGTTGNGSGTTGNGSETTGNGSETTGNGMFQEIAVDVLIDRLCENADVPAYEAIPLGEKNFEFFAFAPYNSEYSAYAADALVNVTAHSLVVIKCNDDNTQKLAETIAENANIRKWLCVSAETVKVAYSDHYVMLVMSFEDTTEKLLENFKALTTEMNDGEVSVLNGKGDTAGL